MASKTFQYAQNILRSSFLVRKNRFQLGHGAKLPDAYKKFWTEWKTMHPAAVHFIPDQGRWKKDEVTGDIHPVQNVPLPLRHPIEFDRGLWGGEAVIKGFQKRHRYNRRVPHFWVPHLKRAVVRSEVLNVYLSTVVTNRTLNLINDNYGFDHYLLKTPACDLRSILALKLKKKILEALLDKCPAYNDQPEKQQEIYDEYKSYLTAYTPEEIEWYGLTWDEAIKKIAEISEIENAPKPLKHEFRSKLIENLNTHGVPEVKKTVHDQMPGASWISKMNPFGKKHET